MKKLNLLAVLGACLVAAIVVNAETVKLNRLTRGIQVSGGTSTTTGNTLVVSESPSNEMKIVVQTATVASGSTAATNAFATAFLADPTVVVGQVHGVVGGIAGNVTVSVSPTRTVVSNLAYGTSTNSIPLIIYGYQRSGILE